MTESINCAECGAPIPANWLEGYCPQCLLGLASTFTVEEPLEPGRPALQDGLPRTSTPSGYELLEVLGEGGMGVVYKARQRALNRVVALKMIRSGAFASGSEVRRFRSEAQAVAKLQHPNVVTIHDVGEQDGRPYFSMEYIEGKNLAQIIRQTPLSPERAARYVETIATTVHHAHQRGILHRDLKPANILIDAADQPRITDFGLAKHLEDDTEFTVSGAVMGTPSYMPPEQAAGRRQEIGPASDVYSLGAILYDLLIGRPPFRADTPVDTLRQVLDDDPAPLRLLNRIVPRDLETICLKCLAKEPSHRYASAQELADDLKRFRNREPIRARPIGYAGRFWRWGRRNPTLAALSGLVLLTFGLVAVAALLFRQEMKKAILEESVLAAEVIAHELTQLKETVARAATTPQLPPMAPFYQGGDTNALRDHLAGLASLVNEKGWPWMGTTNAFESWSAFDTNGILLARWPVAETEWSHGFADRDHFKGAWDKYRETGVATPHVARAFHSRTDRSDKFGISIVVLREDDTNAPAVGTLMATITTAPSFRRKDIDFKAVLIAKADPSDHGSRESYLIMVHPAFQRHDDAISIKELPLPAEGSGGLYVDPAASVYRNYSGLWLAVQTNIPESPFTVIVQRRDRIIDALGTALLVAVLAGLTLLVWRLVRRRRIARTKPGP